MSTAPRGSYSSWVLPDGRLVELEVISAVHPRQYRVTGEVGRCGTVVRWQSAAPGRAGFPASVWRALTPDGNWVYRTGDEPMEWPTRGDAVDRLIQIADGRA